jgi:mono/diheme cytochrome c family protein
MIGRSIAVVICLAAFSATAAEVSLEKNLMPLFQRSCGTCHEPDSGIRGAIKDGAFFNTKKDILDKVGKSIIPGKPDESGLVKVLDQTKKFGKKELVMPPPNADVPKWTEEEIASFKSWITAGAKDN